MAAVLACVCRQLGMEPCHGRLARVNMLHHAITCTYVSANMPPSNRLMAFACMQGALPRWWQMHRRPQSQQLLPAAAPRHQMHWWWLVASMHATQALLLLLLLVMSGSGCCSCSTSFCWWRQNCGQQGGLDAACWGSAAPLLDIQPASGLRHEEPRMHLTRPCRAKPQHGAR